MQAMKDHVVGTLMRFMLLTVLATTAMCSAAQAVTAGEVQGSCSMCHGLTVNGVVVSAGLGSYGFMANVSGRNQATWATTIARMTGYGAVVADVNGTAAYLAGLGAQPATPTRTSTPSQSLTTTPTRTSTLPQNLTATPTRTSTLPQNLTATPTRTSTLPQNLTATPTRTSTLPQNLTATPTRTSTALQQTTATPTRTSTSAQQTTTTPTRSATRTRTSTSTPSATSSPVTGSVSGAAAYGSYCARCHEPASPAFVGQTVYRASTGDIAEALTEVTPMQFLRPLLSRDTITAIADYLRARTPTASVGGTTTATPTRAATRTPTATPTPSATATPVTGNVSGAAAYASFCARCHEPVSPGFVGETVYGASAGAVTEALGEVRQMQFLRPLLSRDTVTAIAGFLRTRTPTGQSGQSPSERGEGGRSKRPGGERDD